MLDHPGPMELIEVGCSHPGLAQLMRAGNFALFAAVIIASDRAALVRRCGLEQTRWAIFHSGSARNGPARPGSHPYDHAPSRTAASSSLADEELRPDDPRSRTGREWDVPVGKRRLQGGFQGSRNPALADGSADPNLIISILLFWALGENGGDPVTAVGVVVPGRVRKSPTTTSLGWWSRAASPAAAATLVLIAAGRSRHRSHHGVSPFSNAGMSRS